MTEQNYKLTKLKAGEEREETLKIEYKRLAKASLYAYRFVDKDSHQIVFHIPSIDVSGYGETFEKAKEMLRFAVNDFFEFVVNLKPSEVKIELAKYGWKQRIFQHKQFSKAYINGDGELENLNAEEGTVERFALVA